MNQIETYILQDIRKSVDIPKEKIEEMLGITIKKVIHKKPTKGMNYYNIYSKDTGKLLAAKILSSDLEFFFDWIGYDIYQQLTEEPEKDDNLDEQEKVFEIQQQDMEKYEKKYYKKCPICGFEYDSRNQSHFHRRSIL